VAKFRETIELTDGTSFDMPAETCAQCKGIGYVTQAVTYTIQKARSETAHIHRAESGDRCPLCLGRGWVGVVGSGE
jgi:RecJ-like exonuclease